MDEDNKRSDSLGFSMQEDKLSTEDFVIPFQGQYDIAKKHCSSGNRNMYYARKSLKEDFNDKPGYYEQDLRATPLVNDNLRGYPTCTPNDLAVSNVISDLARRDEPYSSCKTAKNLSRCDSDPLQYDIGDNLKSQSLKDVDQPCSDVFENDGCSTPSCKISNSISANYSSLTELQIQKSELACDAIGLPNHKSTAIAKVAKICEYRHFENKPFTCSKCSARFCFRSQLMRHNVLHDKKVALVCCNTCGTMFETQRGLSLHRKVHNVKNAQNHQCLICGAHFLLSGSLHTHIKLVHQKNVCTGCGVTFTFRKELTAHKVKCPYFVPRDMAGCTAKEAKLLKQIREHKLLKYFSGKKQMSE